MGGGKTEAPQPAPVDPLQRENWQLTNEAIRQQQRQNDMLAPVLAAQSYYKIDPEGNYVKMTEEEKLSSMSPLEQKQYQAANLQADRLTRALEGKLPVSPSLEQDLANQQKNLFEDKSRMLGSNWQNSTPGIQALSEYNKRAAALREGVQKGEIDTGTSLLLGQMGAQQDYANSYQNRLLGTQSPRYNLLNAYNQFGSSLQQGANAQNQIAMFNAQQRAQSQAGTGKLAGTLLGAGAGFALSGGNPMGAYLGASVGSRI